MTWMAAISDSERAPVEVKVTKSEIAFIIPKAILS